MPPRQGEVWRLELSPGRGHEQAGQRPALVLSVDKFNGGPAGLVIVAPLTSVAKGQPLHVRIEPPEGGVRETSFAKAEDVRSVSSERLVDRLGAVERSTLRAVTRRVALLIHS
ncbi:MAG: type II toxin-antitoxin system PemK/MazF family toxin [Actinomycetota bacterium]|nr:type II toxin-antitoxin system PemK/MazF family toxin [Actinomycetota bacterium]